MLDCRLRNFHTLFVFNNNCVLCPTLTLFFSLVGTYVYTNSRWNQMVWKFLKYIEITYFIVPGGVRRVICYVCMNSTRKKRLVVICNVFGEIRALDHARVEVISEFGVWLSRSKRCSILRWSAGCLMYKIVYHYDYYCWWSQISRETAGIIISYGHVIVVADGRGCVFVKMREWRARENVANV